MTSPRLPAQLMMFSTSSLFFAKESRLRRGPPHTIYPPKQVCSNCSPSLSRQPSAGQLITDQLYKTLVDSVGRSYRVYNVQFTANKAPKLFPSTFLHRHST